MNLSPSGTAFFIGSVTYFQDWELRKELLRTAEIAGFTLRGWNKNHYLLANMALSVKRSPWLCERACCGYIGQSEICWKNRLSTA